MIEELIAKYSDDKLAEVPGMVYQVWEDGEVTLQKCGELLWQRNLHCIALGFSGFSVPMPHKMNGHSYMFTTEEGAKMVHREIAKMFGKHPMF